MTFHLYVGLKHLLREFMQTVARLSRENAPRKLDRTKPWRIELDTTAFQFCCHELAIELHVVRNKNAVIQVPPHVPQSMQTAVAPEPSHR